MDPDAVGVHRRVPGGGLALWVPIALLGERGSSGGLHCETR